MKTTTKTIYETIDGKQFFSEQEARVYEEELKHIKYFCVRHSPDLNETGLFTDSLYLKVTTDREHKLIVEDFCYKQFKSRVAYVQGVSRTWNWSYHLVNKEDIDSSKKLIHLDNSL